MAANLSGDLTDLLLVDTLDVHVGVVGNLEGDALGSLDDHGVREAQGELEVLALLLHAVTDAASSSFFSKPRKRQQPCCG